MVGGGGRGSSSLTTTIAASELPTEAAAAAAVDDCALAVTAGDAADCEELTPLDGILENEEAEFLLNDLISKVSPVLLLYVLIPALIFLKPSSSSGFPKAVVCL